MAYLRVLDPYREGVVANAARRLVAWAERAGVAEHNWFGYMWDEPEVVELKDCRYDIAVEADDFVPTGEIGQYEFPAMRIAQLSIRGGIDLEMRALDWLYRTWLPTSGYVPDDQPCFEAWIGRPFAHGLSSTSTCLSKRDAGPDPRPDLSIQRGCRFKTQSTHGC